MKRSLFITSQKDGAGKIVVALGSFKYYKKNIKRVGNF